MTDWSPGERIEIMARALDAVRHSVAGPLQEAINRAFAVRRRLALACPEADEMMAELEHDLRTIAGNLHELTALPRAGLVVAEKPVPLTEIARAASILSRLPESGLRLIVETAPSVAAHVDAQQVARAVAELIVNAAEAAQSDGTGVALRVSADAGLARFSVIDQASAAWPDPPERALDPLYTSKAQALGLGLALAYRIAAAAGGSIHIEPQTTGSVVTLTIPILETGHDD